MTSEKSIDTILIRQQMGTTETGKSTEQSKRQSRYHCLKNHWKTCGGFDACVYYFQRAFQQFLRFTVFDGKWETEK